MDVSTLKKELNNASESKDEELTKDILSRLASVPVSKELIQSSGIGKVLGKLGKCDWSDSVGKQAKDLVLEWKNKLKSGTAAAAPAKPFAPVVESPASSKKPSRQSVSEPVVVKEITGERKRDTIIAKLNGAMRAVLADAADLDITEESLWAKATEIEAILNRDYASNPHQHKTKFLQLVRNLRDEKNSQLRVRVAVGYLECEELLKLSAIDLAPEDVQVKDFFIFFIFFYFFIFFFN
jgi:hypothetical protein